MRAINKLLHSNQHHLSFIHLFILTMNLFKSNNLDENKLQKLLTNFDQNTQTIRDVLQSIQPILDDFTVECRLFSKELCPTRLKRVVTAYEQMANNFARVIKEAHTDFTPRHREWVKEVTPRVFNCLFIGIQLLRMFYSYMEKKQLMNQAEAKLFLESTQRASCPFMSVYAESNFFDSMGRLCTEEAMTEETKRDICRLTVQYRSAKDHLDNLGASTEVGKIKKYSQEIQHLLDTWKLFLDKVAQFIIRNYLRLYERDFVPCFQKFLDQQYQIMFDYHSQYTQLKMQLGAERKRKAQGFI